MRGIVGRSVGIVFLILVGSIYVNPGSTASNRPPGTLTTELEFDEDGYNISESREPITFRGWLNWSG